MKNSTKKNAATFQYVLLNRPVIRSIPKRSVRGNGKIPKLPAKQSWIQKPGVFRRQYRGIAIITSVSMVFPETHSQHRTASYQIIYLLVVTLSLAATTVAEEPVSAASFRLWAKRTIVPTADEAEEIPSIRFSRIKQREPEIDGCR
jgi:hypothetical protein